MPKRDPIAEAIARTSIEKDIASIQKDVKEINEKLDNKYVTKEEVEVLRQALNRVSIVVYGFCGLVLTAMIVAWIKLVIIKQ